MCSEMLYQWQLFKAVTNFKIIIITVTITITPCRKAKESQTLWTAITFNSYLSLRITVEFNMSTLNPNYHCARGIICRLTRFQQSKTEHASDNQWLGSLYNTVCIAVPSPTLNKSTELWSKLSILAIFPVEWTVAWSGGLAKWLARWL